MKHYVVERNTEAVAEKCFIKTSALKNVRKIHTFNVCVNKKNLLKNIQKWCISEKLSDDPLVNAIRKYENHPTIIKIKSSVELFDFNFVSSDDISKIIN